MPPNIPHIFLQNLHVCTCYDFGDHIYFSELTGGASTYLYSQDSTDISNAIHPVLLFVREVVIRFVDIGRNVNLPCLNHFLF